MSQRYQSFREFYPFYLSEHANPACRRMQHPVYSLIGDWVMFRDMLTGRIRW